MWSVWDKQSDINGFSAEAFLARNPHLKNNDVIYIKTVNGKVTQVEGKHVLAMVYEIDETLGNEEFVVEYERVISMPPEEVEPIATLEA